MVRMFIIKENVEKPEHTILKNLKRICIVTKMYF